MLKASNNHFGDRSKIKIPKIRPFCYLKSENIAKERGKYFQCKFLKMQHAENILKIPPYERGDKMHLLHLYFLVSLRMPPPSNIHAEYSYHTISWLYSTASYPIKGIIHPRPLIITRAVAEGDNGR